MIVSDILRLTQQEVANVLHMFDKAFSPMLSSEIDLDSYARKLSKRASFIIVTLGGHFIGFTACYVNLEQSKIYVPLIGVLPQNQRIGVGRQMLDTLKKVCCNNSINIIMLEVYKNNHKAYSFYIKNGFVKAEDRGEKWLMSLQLGTNKTGNVSYE